MTLDAPKINATFEGKFGSYGPPYASGFLRPRWSLSYAVLVETYIAASEVLSITVIIGYLDKYIILTVFA